MRQKSETCLCAGCGRSNHCCPRLTHVKVIGERHSSTKFLHEWLLSSLITPDALLEPPPNWNRLLAEMRKREGGTWDRSRTDEEAYFTRTFDENLGWKHALVNASRVRSALTNNCSNTLIVCTARHPIDWLQSMQHRTYADGPKMGSWLPQPRLMPFATARVPYNTLEGRGYDSPIEMWSAKLRACIDLARWGCSVFLSRVEDLQADAGLCRLIGEFPCPMPWQPNSSHVRVCAKRQAAHGASRSRPPEALTPHRPVGFDGRLVLLQSGSGGSEHPEALAAQKAPTGLTAVEVEALSTALTRHIDPSLCALTRYSLSLPLGSVGISNGSTQVDYVR